MGFYVFDPKGYRQPYHPEANWRSLPEAQEASPFTETKREEAKTGKDEIKPVEDFLTFKQEAGLPSKIFAYQIMSHPVIAVRPDTTLLHVWEYFIEHRFRHIPIVSKRGKIMGIVSDRRILSELNPITHKLYADIKQQTIAEVMQTHVLTAEPNTDISNIAKVFIKERVGCMPIVDQEHQLVGIITRSDILRLLVGVDFFEIRA